MIKQFLMAAALCLGITACTNDTCEKIPVYGWQGDNKNISDNDLLTDFKQLKAHGLDGICYGAGFNIERIEIASKAAKDAGLEYHAWVPAMLYAGADSTWYAINRKGESAYIVQAYTPGYKFLCPNNPEVIKFLTDKYVSVAEIEDVDYVHLDFIRYPDVILSRGLWEKYGLVMNEEYPTADYCYCDKCVADFKAESGIDIKSVKDPSTCEEWKKFRYNVIAKLVKNITDAVHAKGKKVSAAVFPGPSYAMKLVRQEWNTWNIDAFFPMNYNDFYLEPAEWVGKVTQEEVNSVNGEKPIYSGLFICRDWKNRDNIKDPEGKGLIPSEIPNVVRDVMKTGAAGVALYNTKDMTDLHWKELKKAIYKSK